MNLPNNRLARIFDHKDFEGDPEGLKYVQEMERKIYSEILDNVINNPRYYLDNLDNLSVLSISFINYNQKKRRVYK